MTQWSWSFGRLGNWESTFLNFFMLTGNMSGIAMDYIKLYYCITDCSLYSIHFSMVLCASWIYSDEFININYFIDIS